MKPSSVAHGTFVVERTYNVPVAQVFRAWAGPTFKARWFGGGAERLGAGYELDFRVGGRELNRGGPPGGPVYIYESQYRDIVADQRIVYTYEMSADQLVITGQGVFLDGHDTADQRKQGTLSLLGALGTFLGGGAS